MTIGNWLASTAVPPPAKFDVIIVPMLGFDPETLHRIGYGGGYYDKFLAIQPQAKKSASVSTRARPKTCRRTTHHDIALNVILN